MAICFHVIKITKSGLITNLRHDVRKIFFFETTESGLIFNEVRIHPETVQLSPFYRKHPKEKRKDAHIPGSFCFSNSAADLDLAVEDEEEQGSC
jgi:hypothetical protein